MSPFPRAPNAARQNFVYSRNSVPSGRGKGCQGLGAAGKGKPRAGWGWRVASRASVCVSVRCCVVRGGNADACSDRQTPSRRFAAPLFTPVRDGTPPRSLPAVRLCEPARRESAGSTRRRNGSRYDAGWLIDAVSGGLSDAEPLLAAAAGCQGPVVRGGSAGARRFAEATPTRLASASCSSAVPRSRQQSDRRCLVCSSVRGVSQTIECIHNLTSYLVEIRRGRICPGGDITQLSAGVLALHVLVGER